MNSLILRNGGAGSIPECNCNPQNHRIYWSYVCDVESFRIPADNNNLKEVIVNEKDN